jgi:hypothetical protein
VARDQLLSSSSAGSGESTVPEEASSSALEVTAAGGTSPGYDALFDEQYFGDPDDFMQDPPNAFMELDAEVEAFLKKKCVSVKDMEANDNVADLGTGPLRELYIRHNTRLPASAVAERIFSLTGRVLSPLRNKLTNFLGTLVFVKANWDLIEFFELAKKKKTAVRK